MSTHRPSAYDRLEELIYEEKCYKSRVWDKGPEKNPTGNSMVCEYPSSYYRTHDLGQLGTVPGMPGNDPVLAHVSNPSHKYPPGSQKPGMRSILNVHSTGLNQNLTWASECLPRDCHPPWLSFARSTWLLICHLRRIGPRSSHDMLLDILCIATSISFACIKGKPSYGKLSYL